VSKVAAAAAYTTAAVSIILPLPQLITLPQPPALKPPCPRPLPQESIHFTRESQSSGPKSRILPATEAEIAHEVLFRIVDVPDDSLSEGMNTKYLGAGGRPTSGIVLQTAICYLEAVRPEVRNMLRKERMCIRAYYDPESRILAATEVEIAHEVLSVWVIMERARVRSMPRCSYCCSRCHVNGNKDVLTANLPLPWPQAVKNP
jgi:hypothetical protein